MLISCVNPFKSVLSACYEVTKLVSLPSERKYINMIIMKEMQFLKIFPEHV